MVHALILTLHTHVLTAAPVASASLIQSAVAAQAAEEAAVVQHQPYRLALRAANASTTAVETS